MFGRSKPQIQPSDNTLAEKARILDAIYDAFPVIEISADGNLLSVNEAFTSMMKTNAAQIIGKPISAMTSGKPAGQFPYKKNRWLCPKDDLLQNPQTV